MCRVWSAVMKTVEQAARYAAEYVVSRTGVFTDPEAIVAEAVRVTALHLTTLKAQKTSKLVDLLCASCDGRGCPECPDAGIRVLDFVTQLRPLLAALSDDERRDAFASIACGWCRTCGTAVPDRGTCHCANDE